jgi:hypothetical protein
MNHDARNFLIRFARLTIEAHTTSIALESMRMEKISLFLQLIIFSATRTLSTYNWREGIRTCDFYFIKHDLQPVKLPLKDKNHYL